MATETTQIPDDLKKLGYDALVRVVHAIAHAPPISVIISGQEFITKYGDITWYKPFSCVNPTIEFNSFDPSKIDLSIAERLVRVKPGHRYTLIFKGTADPDDDYPHVVSLQHEDSIPLPSPDSCMIRVLHFGPSEDGQLLCDGVELLDSFGNDFISPYGSILGEDNEKRLQIKNAEGMIIWEDTLPIYRGCFATIGIFDPHHNEQGHDQDANENEGHVRYYHDWPQKDIPMITTPRADSLDESQQYPLSPSEALLPHTSAEGPVVYPLRNASLNDPPPQVSPSEEFMHLGDDSIPIDGGGGGDKPLESSPLRKEQHAVMESNNPKDYPSYNNLVQSENPLYRSNATPPSPVKASKNSPLRVDDVAPPTSTVDVSPGGLYDFAPKDQALMEPNPPPESSHQLVELTEPSVETDDHSRQVDEKSHALLDLTAISSDTSNTTPPEESKDQHILVDLTNTTVDDHSASQSVPLRENPPKKDRHSSKEEQPSPKSVVEQQQQQPPEEVEKEMEIEVDDDDEDDGIPTPLEKELIDEAAVVGEILGAATGVESVKLFDQHQDDQGKKIEVELDGDENVFSSDQATDGRFFSDTGADYESDTENDEIHVSTSSSEQPSSSSQPSLTSVESHPPANAHEKHPSYENGNDVEQKKSKDSIKKKISEKNQHKEDKKERKKREKQDKRSHVPPPRESGNKNVGASIQVSSYSREHFLLPLDDSSSFSTTNTTMDDDSDVAEDHMKHLMDYDHQKQSKESLWYPTSPSKGSLDRNNDDHVSKTHHSFGDDNNIKGESFDVRTYDRTLYENTTDASESVLQNTPDMLAHLSNFQKTLETAANEASAFIERQRDQNTFFVNNDDDHGAAAAATIDEFPPLLESWTDEEKRNLSWIGARHTHSVKPYVLVELSTDLAQCKLLVDKMAIILRKKTRLCAKIECGEHFLRGFCVRAALTFKPGCEYRMIMLRKPNRTCELVVLEKELPQ